MKNSALFTLLAITFLATACVSPQPISQLNASDESPSFWHQGQEVVHLTKDDLTVEVAHYPQAGEFYVFDFAVYNESGDDILIDPKSFYYLPVVSASDTLSVVYAEDPEDKLLEMDKELSRIEAERINESISSALVATAELTAVVASEVSDSDPYEKEELRASIRENRYYRQAERNELEYKNLSLQEQRTFWETQTLRKTTLFPQQYITGQVFFDKQLKANEILLHIPVNDDLFAIRFHQELLPVK